MLFFIDEGCLSAEKTIFGLSTNMQARAFSDLIKSAKKSKEHLPKVKMFLLGDTSLQFLNQAIVGQTYENAINLEIKEFDFNAIDLGIAQMDENTEKNHTNILIANFIEFDDAVWGSFANKWRGKIN